MFEDIDIKSPPQNETPLFDFRPERKSRLEKHKILRMHEMVEFKQDAYW